MKISELTKGLTGEVSGLGKVKIIGLSKKYIKVKQLDFGGIDCKMYFKTNELEISSLKLTLD